MMNEISKTNKNITKELTNVEFHPTIVTNDYPVENYTKFPIGQLSSLGTGFNQIGQQIVNFFNASGSTTQLCKITIPSGTHLAELKDGTAKIGALLDENNQLAGQAKINPLSCDPAAMAMAVTMFTINQKLDDIKETQQDIVNWLVSEKRTEQQGNIEFLSDILNNYKFNWDDALYKSSNLSKVLDIKQTANNNILFYKEKIKSILEKKDLITMGADVEKRKNELLGFVKDYELAVYMFSFSSFIGVTLQENYNKDYLDSISNKIKELSNDYYKTVETTSIHLESLANKAIETKALEGLSFVTKNSGKLLDKVPVLKDKEVGNKLNNAGDKLIEIKGNEINKTIKPFIEKQQKQVLPFIENINSINYIQNNDTNLIFDNEYLYIEEIH